MRASLCLYHLPLMTLLVVLMFTINPMIYVLDQLQEHVEAEPRSETEEENLGKALPKDISDTHLLPYSTAILDDLPDKMDDPGVPTISCLIGTQKFDQAL
jgi:hypothetical protein